MLGSFAVWRLFASRSEIVSGSFFESADWIAWGTLAVGLAFIWLCLLQIYLKSFGVSLKAISLKEIEIASTDEDSILNRHLDEIIYFFQSTNYELVVIEDLDRFEDPEIFTNLREINGLINTNSGVKRQVRFLYALRDDMFINRDRTKFFEFIVPIVPIINHSNSIDKVIEQGKRLELVKRLDNQFLREVSRYLSDLRLIRNIFNEYALYEANLKAGDDDGLDPNKMLAVLIYKNVLPRDFELLHQQKGALADLLNLHDTLIERKQAALRAKIAHLEQEATEAEKQLPKDVEELKKIYAMAIIEQIPEGHLYIKHGNEWIPIGKLTHRTDFEEIADRDEIHSSISPRHSPSLSANHFALASTGRRARYAERLEEVQNKNIEIVSERNQEITDIKARISEVRVQKFNEVIRSGAAETNDCFKGFGENQELMRFLILEGHLDDTYYQYISLFHSGRLSPSDNKFLIKIRSFNTPEPDFQIDNAAEVVAAMRAEDFGLSYVLNRHLFDFLLSDIIKNSGHLSKAVDFISEQFADCEAFFSDYYERGKQVPAFIHYILSKWSKFPKAAFESQDRHLHMARILAYAPKSVLETLLSDPQLFLYFNDSLVDVLKQRVEFDADRLTELRLRVVDLKNLNEFADTTKFLVQNSLFRINRSNVDFIMREFSGWTDETALSEKPYSSVLASNNVPLIERVENDFDEYLFEVLSEMEDATQEEAGGILKLLAHENADKEALEHYWLQQEATLERLSEIPKRFYLSAITFQKVEPTYENCLEFHSSEQSDNEALTQYLERPETLEALQENISGDETFAGFRKFLIHNDNMQDDAYEHYVSRLPKAFNAVPSELSEEKLHIIVRHAGVTFTPENYNALSLHPNIQAIFVRKNFATFWTNRDKYSVGEGLLSDLLGSDLHDDQKRDIVDLLDPPRVVADRELSALVGPVLDNTHFDPHAFEPDFLRSLIVNAGNEQTQISLFCKSAIKFDKNELGSIVEDLKWPYSQISAFGRFPKIPNTTQNKEFVDVLQEREIISSYRISASGRDIRINTFRKSWFSG